MCELRKLFLLVDTYDLKIRTQYIKSTAIVWADNLSRISDNSDWKLAPRVFRHLISLWGAHTIDQFASSANKQLPRYNAKWRDGTAEALDFLRLTDAEWRAEINWRNPPWELLDDLVIKLRNSGAEASVIAPYWPEKPWFVHLAAMSIEPVDVPPTETSSLRRSVWDKGGVGPSAWSVVAFRLPLRPGCC